MAYDPKRKVRGDRRPYNDPGTPGALATPDRALLALLSQSEDKGLVAKALNPAKLQMLTYLGLAYIKDHRAYSTMEGSRWLGKHP